VIGPLTLATRRLHGKFISLGIINALICTPLNDTLVWKGNSISFVIKIVVVAEHCLVKGTNKVDNLFFEEKNIIVSKIKN
jgi:hypothetical protein